MSLSLNLCRSLRPIHSHTHNSLSHSHSPTLSHSLTHSLTLSLFVVIEDSFREFRGIDEESVTDQIVERLLRRFVSGNDSDHIHRVHHPNGPRLASPRTSVVPHLVWGTSRRLNPCLWDTADALGLRWLVLRRHCHSDRHESLRRVRLPRVQSLSVTGQVPHLFEFNRMGEHGVHNGL